MLEYISIVSKLIVRRNELGLSQSALANRLGGSWTQSKVARFESFKPVRIEALLDICKSLGMKLTLGIKD